MGLWMDDGDDRMNDRWTDGGKDILDNGRVEVWMDRGKDGWIEGCMMGER